MPKKFSPSEKRFLIETVNTYKKEMYLRDACVKAGISQSAYSSWQRELSYRIPDNSESLEKEITILRDKVTKLENILKNKLLEELLNADT